MQNLLKKVGAFIIMKILLVSLFLAVLLLSGKIGTIPFHTSSLVKAETPPAYAKWGQIAMQKTKEKYPNANIVDYLHVGRVNHTKSATEKFKLWLKDKDKEFGVLVDIEFEKTSEKIIKITYKEVKRN
jgi:hypothetical protein